MSDQSHGKLTDQHRENIPADTKAVHQVVLAARNLSEDPDSLADAELVREGLNILEICNVAQYLDAALDPALHDVAFECPDIKIAVETDQGSLLVTHSGDLGFARRNVVGWIITTVVGNRRRIVAVPEDGLTSSLLRRLAA